MSDLLPLQFAVASLGQTRGGALTWESPELFYDVAVDVSVVVCIWFSTVSN